MAKSKKKRIRVVRIGQKKLSDGFFKSPTYASWEVTINEWVEKNNINVDDIISIQYPNDNVYETGHQARITYKEIVQ